jgi:soluble lytic murein transglycosylase-like protein
MATVSTRISRHETHCVLAMVLALACGSAIAEERADAASLPTAAQSRSPWQSAAEKYDLEPIYLYAIALHESRRHRPDGMIRPWPWTLHTRQTGSLYFETYDAALEMLTALLVDVTNIDVGLMQINWGWNGHLAPDARTLLEPASNIEIAAQLLREHLNECEGDLHCAIARYHSPRPERGIPYAASVLAIVEHLRSVPAIEIALME